MSDTWSRGEKIAIIGILLTILSVVAAVIVVPEVRLAIGLDKPSDSTRVDLSVAVEEVIANDNVETSATTTTLTNAFSEQNNTPSRPNVAVSSRRQNPSSLSTPRNPESTSKRHPPDNAEPVASTRSEPTSTIALASLTIAARTDRNIAPATPSVDTGMRNDSSDALPAVPPVPTGGSTTSPPFVCVPSCAAEFAELPMRRYDVPSTAPASIRTTEYVFTTNRDWPTSRFIHVIISKGTYMVGPRSRRTKLNHLELEVVFTDSPAKGAVGQPCEWEEDGCEMFILANNSAVPSQRYRVKIQGGDDPVRFSIVLQPVE